ncbi:PREDICTED: thioredoxin domain-containing protein 3 [Chaetura pelagica]|nr:PREDICTED: thioredoxin domain-containing protein 3 [Chaetura pelagica]
MASKKKEVQLQTTINDENQWNEMLLKKGVTVIDVYQAWCGPCKAVMNLFRKLRTELGEEDMLHFSVAEADSVPVLQPFRNSCEPVFLFCVNGKIIAEVRGANGPLITKKATELVQEEKDIAAGTKERVEVEELVFLERISSEESTEEEEPEPKEIVQYSIAIIKPDAVLEGRVEEVKKKIKNAGFGIEAEEEKMLTEEQIRVFYARKKDQPDFEDFVQAMLSGPCHVLVIAVKETSDAIPHWKELRKLSEDHDAEADKPDRIQGAETEESILNLCDIQDSLEDASRQLAFFFPNFDKKKTDQKVEKTLALIRPTLLKERRDSIIQRIKDDGFQIAMQKEIILTEAQAREFYKEHENEDYFPVLLEQMTSGPTLILALTRENAVEHWRSLLGPKVVETAKKENPESLRAMYAFNDVPINQLHGSSTLDDAQKELDFFFPQEHTLAVIKPDAAKTHKDDIMQRVKDAGFTISKIKEQALTHEMATQFYDQHKGKPFFDDLVSFMTEGPSVIMVLTKENAVEEWRQLMGPTNPEEAKQTCPESIRAQFAHDILSNAVHGSSTQEHALKSIECVFGEIEIA